MKDDVGIGANGVHWRIFPCLESVSIHQIMSLKKRRKKRDLISFNILILLSFISHLTVKTRLVLFFEDT